MILFELFSQFSEQCQIFIPAFGLAVENVGQKSDNAPGNGAWR
jgi:hypothetical protein